MDVHFREMLRVELELLAFGVEWAGGLGGLTYHLLTRGRGSR